ncbi:UNVERIFIED_CONTAM: hypothetical protein FKN15_025007 [Acipenser sinensis]
MNVIAVVISFLACDIAASSLLHCGLLLLPLTLDPFGAESLLCLWLVALVKLALLSLLSQAGRGSAVRGRAPLLYAAALCALTPALQSWQRAVYVKPVEIVTGSPCLGFCLLASAVTATACLFWETALPCSAGTEAGGSSGEEKKQQARVLFMRVIGYSKPDAVLLGGAFLFLSLAVISKEVQDSIARSNEAAGEAVSAIKTVRSFATEDTEAKRYDSKLSDTQRLKNSRDTIRAAHLLLRRLITLAVQVVMLYYGRCLIKAGEMSTGSLVAFILYQRELGSHIRALVYICSNMLNSVGAAAKVFEYLDRRPLVSTDGSLQPETLRGHVQFKNVSFTYPSRPDVRPRGFPLALVYICSNMLNSVGSAAKVFEYLDRRPLVSTDGSLQPETLRGHVQFKNVSFTYPSRPDMPVIKSISFELRPGEITALVGPSGGGKSTCVCLLERFYQPQSGEILLDGAPLQDYQHSYLHRKIALVGQEPVLFAGSIKDNIGYGLPECSLERAQEAARRANAHGFVTSLERGYNTGFAMI